MGKIFHRVVPMLCKHLAPMYTYVYRFMRVRYYRLNVSGKEHMLSYYIVMNVSWMIMIIDICALHTTIVIVYIHITMLIAMIWLMYKEIVKPPPAPIIRSLNLAMYLGCQLDDHYGFPGDH